jgi:hypothetical protein
MQASRLAETIKQVERESSASPTPSLLGSATGSCMGQPGSIASNRMIERTANDSRPGLEAPEPADTSVLADSCLVALLLEPSLEYLVAVLGCICAG